MTKAQRQVVRRQLLDEKAVLSQLRTDYKEALSRVDSKIQELMGRQDLTPSVIYQVRYQRMVKEQIEEALGNLRSGACQHISDYTEGAYKTAFVGAQYSMQKTRGTPCLPDRQGRDGKGGQDRQPIVIVDVPAHGCQRHRVAKLRFC